MPAAIASRVTPSQRQAAQAQAAFCALWSPGRVGTREKSNLKPSASIRLPAWKEMPRCTTRLRATGTTAISGRWRSVANIATECSSSMPITAQSRRVWRSKMCALAAT